MVADLSRRLETCEGRLETRVAELDVKLDGVCSMERTAHSPASQACRCSGPIEAVAAKVGSVNGIYVHGESCMLEHDQFFCNAFSRFSKISLVGFLCVGFLEDFVSDPFVF